MKHVLAAFMSIIGPNDKRIEVSEFSDFWKSCSPELKTILVQNAEMMGFYSAV